MKNINIPIHMSDELLFSYISRIAEANAMTVPRFVNTYMFSDMSVEQARCALDYGSVNNLPLLAMNLDMDPVDLFMKTTLYPGIAPLIPQNKQTQYVNVAFRGNKKLPGIITFLHSDVSELKRCSICWDEEGRSYGFGWYHRAHHMPGVTVCHKHGIRLQPMRYDHGKLVLAESVPGESAPVQQEEIEYAKFAKDFLDAKLETNGKKLRKVVIDHMNSMLYDELYISNLINKDPRKTLHYLICDNYYTSSTDLLMVLFYIFRDVKSIPACTDEALLFSLIMESAKDYDIMEPYRSTIIKMRVKQTGEEFVTTPRGFILGWREYSGDNIGEQEKYKQLLQLAKGGLYEPISPFRGMSEKVTVLHTLCGEKYTVRARAILEEDANCKCLTCITERKVRHELEGTGDWELLKYYPASKKLAVRSSRCGHLFVVSYRAWKSRAYCRICMKDSQGNSIYSSSPPPLLKSEAATERFAERMLDLVGDEYSLEDQVEDVLEPVKIRHNKCGQTFITTPNLFTQGARCQCVKFPEGKEFIRYVSDRTCGQYTAERDHGSQYKITNTATGEYKLMRKQVIIQEIERPTPSAKIPLDKKGEYIRRKGVQETVLDWLNCHYLTGDIFYLDHLEKTGLTKQQRRNALDALDKSKRSITTRQKKMTCCQSRQQVRE